MANKKIFFFALLLFINAYLFILFDRLSYGLPAGFLISLFFAILFVGPSLFSFVYGYKLVSNEPIISWIKLYLKMLLSVLIPASISAIIFFYLKYQGISEYWIKVSHSVFSPVKFFGAGILIFVIISGIILFFMLILLLDINRFRKSIKILGYSAILLSVLTLVFLYHCSSDGCRNKESLVEKAIYQKNPDACNGPKLGINFRSNIPTFFSTIKDPIPYPTSILKINCLYNYYSSIKPEDLPDNISSCILAGFGNEACIAYGLSTHTEPDQCEELKYLKNDQMDDPSLTPYSKCYYALALARNKGKYCLKLNTYEDIKECSVLIIITENVKPE